MYYKMELVRRGVTESYPVTYAAVQVKIMHITLEMFCSFSE